MELLGKIELFSPTAENRFVFSLFDLLLCGVILFVIFWRWRAKTAPVPFRSQLFLFLAFASLGASFTVVAGSTGSLFFLQRRFSAAPIGVLTHSLEAAAWLLLAACAYDRLPRSGEAPRKIRRSLLAGLAALVPAGAGIALLMSPPNGKTAAALDVANLFLLLLVTVIFFRRPLGGRQLGTLGLAFLSLAALLRLVSGTVETAHFVLLWNWEQFACLASLFTFALAIGEASQDLFGKVFVRLQIAFILLASFMILVITQTEKTDYLTSIRGRTDQLAQFVRAHVDLFWRPGGSLSEILDREDFLRRLTLGFGELPELKIVRVRAEGQAAAFEIADSGTIRRETATAFPSRLTAPLDPDDYFLIQTLPLQTAPAGKVEFFGTGEFLNQHIRKRIVLLFSIFTGMVALSTLMIGWVVRGASATIRSQAREIEETQRKLMQASKLAAIGQLAAGVAHEINNPATTILTRTSFMLSQDDGQYSESDREDLETVVTQAQRIAQITRGLLLFSRPHVPQILPVPAARIIESGLRSVRDSLAANHISVDLRMPVDLPRILADEPSLTRALENIFRNAIDAMPGGGSLRIRAAMEASPGARLRMEISDTGAGIDGAILGRIFEPFFTTKEVGRGTGLGLSIAHGIIKELHGSIDVESQPGTGTTFLIVLPAEQ